MAGEKESPESLLGHAKEQERRYDWQGAVATYSNLLSLISKDDVQGIGTIKESTANASYCAAFQSDSLQEFRTGVDKASEDYQKAVDSFMESREGKVNPRMIRCQAMIEFISFWRSEKGPDKRKAVLEAWRLAKESMAAFENQGELLESILTLNSMWTTAIFGTKFADDPDGLSKPCLEVVDIGERILQRLPESGNEVHLAATHTIVGILQEMDTVVHLTFVNQKQDSCQKASHHWQKAIELSRERSTIELVNLCLGDAQGLPFGLGRDDLLAIIESALRMLRPTRDRLRIGFALLCLAYQNEWLVMTIEDSDQLRAHADKVIRYAREANDNFAVVSPLSPILSSWYVDPDADLNGDLAYLEADLAKKREYAQKSFGYSTYVRTSEEMGLPLETMQAKWFRAMTLTELAKTETVPEVRRRVLEEAVRLGHESDIIGEKLEPFPDSKSGWALDVLAESECELASLVDDTSQKLTTYSQGVLDKRSSVMLIKRSIESSPSPDPGRVSLLGKTQYSLGVRLATLFELSRDTKNIREASNMLQESAQSYEKAGMPSRAAESNWMAAQTYELLEDYAKASEMFVLASENFKNAIDKIPRLKDLYEDHSRYMQAWGQVEKARFFHSRQDAASSRDCWSKAAELHESTQRWRYLSSNYSAWSELEYAEELSRKDRNEEAAVHFGSAAELFQKASISIKAQIDRIEGASEKHIAKELMDGSHLRQEYCKARTGLEQAKVLDRSGDESAASERFGRAAETLLRIADATNIDKEKAEFRLVAFMSKAYQSLSRASAEASPELYAEASQHFEQAKDLASGEKLRLIIMGHARFCKALEAGTRFTDSGEVALHSVATQNLNSAANYYMKAGIETSSEYAKASKLLFDGYECMARANREEDQARKSKLYAMTEKILQTSASCYEKANQPSKREQVEKLMAKVREETELAVSLTEILQAPDNMATIGSLPSVSSTLEKATGLSRFEHADVQATMIAKPKDLHVGQELNLEIELVNAGRGSAQLTKVEAVVPVGFVVVQEPDKYRMEDSQINLRGRRLDALKTEDVRLVIKPTSKGRFRFNPHIMYIDDSGANRRCEPTPIDIVVKEMGISGWIRGT
jgi:hypothetical protein